MGIIILQIVFVFALTLMSGFFAGSEIALISIRKTRVSALVKKNNRRAKTVQELQRRPDTLFATTQIGISLLTIFASAFAGTSFSQRLAPILAVIPVNFIAHHSYAIAFVIIVLLVSYVSLLFGELVPKSIAIRYSERFALWASLPIWSLSKLFYPLIRVLNTSSNFITQPVKQSVGFAEAKLSEEEIRTLIDESRNAGTIEPREQQMLENVFEFSDLNVDRIMIPRGQIVAFDVADDPKTNIKKIVESGFSRAPFYKGSLDNIVGILHTKDLLQFLGKDITLISMEKLWLQPFYVPSSQKISDVLQHLQRNKMHMAFVTNEHGEVEGLVTLEDIVEEIVGDISDESDEANKEVVHQKDDSYLVKGEMSIVDFNKYFQSEISEDEQFTTLSGFILDTLERFPKTGDVINFQNLELVVKEKTDRTIKEVVVKKKIPVIN